MLNKREFNFFSGQGQEVAKSKQKWFTYLAIVVLLVGAAITLIVLGNRELNELEFEIETKRQALMAPETLEKLSELEKVKGQLEAVDTYILLITDTTKRIRDSHYASTDMIGRLESLIPPSMEIDELDIQNNTIKMNCKTDQLTDVAVLLNNLNESGVFSKAQTGKVTTDEAGISSFTLDCLYREVTADAAQ